MTVTYFNYLWDIEGISAGSAIKAKEFVAALRRMGHTVYLMWRTPQPTNSQTLKEKIRNHLKKHFGKYAHEPKKLLQNLKHIYEENQIIRQQRPDLILGRLELYNFSGLMLSKLRGIPFVVEADCPPFYEYMKFYGRDYLHLPYLPYIIETANLRFADAIIAISNELKNYFNNEMRIPKEKIYVIPNGADPNKFRPIPKNKNIIERYDLDNKVVIGWIGSLYGWSGIENLIAMTTKVLKQRENVCFMFVGGGENKEIFERAFHFNKFWSRVILPGAVPHSEIPAYLSCMDIVLAPYPKSDFWYPSSMKIFEYMASGKAVIASSIGQINEVIQDGYNGYLFEPDNCAELTEKVLRLIDSPETCNFIGKKARETIVKKYNWDKHAREMEKIFIRVIGQK